MTSLPPNLRMQDGTGAFTEMMRTSFDVVVIGSIAFSDVNGDGREDVFITGQNSSEERIAKLYINDGEISSSEDLVVEISLGFMLFPNPSTPSTLFLSYDSTEPGKVTVKVYNVSGILLSQQKELSAPGQQTLSIDIASLAQGNYLLELDNGKRKGVAKFVVQ